MVTRSEMLELVVEKGRARGIVTRDLVTGELSTWSGDAVVLGTGGYGNVFFLSTNAKGCNVGAAFRAWKKGAYFANPCFTQIHPTCIPVTGDHQSKLTLMSESLRNDGRIWVPKSAADKDTKTRDISAENRDYYLERRYPSFGNLVPRDVASRAAKAVCDEGRGVGASGLGVYLDFEEAIGRLGEAAVRDKYGNLFHMYEKITAENPYQVPMRIYPAVHYTMGGLWVDYNLMSNLPGLFVVGEANFSDHGANRLGASALMQGLADGYFILPYTIGDYLSRSGKSDIDASHIEFTGAKEAVAARIEGLLNSKGSSTPDALHKKLGKILWDYCGMGRNDAGLKTALREIPKVREAFNRDIRVTGDSNGINQTLEKALRLETFIDFGELMVQDALHRTESCGGHFREESQTEEGEALRNDEQFSYAAAWAYKGDNEKPELHKETLTFTDCKPSTRSYK
jgi:succinate dehydrogenase / fumarate reductase flavoprotein subunit